VDVFQGGAGTSVNMNTNEVVANLALELLGYDKGRYDVIHPNDHVNKGQSTNDTYPTAFRLALHRRVQILIEAVRELATSFDTKGEEFADVIKMGRTQLQDAVPMTLGQELSGFATNLREEIRALSRVSQLLLEINLGATAIGTGLNTPDGYAHLATSRLVEVTGLPLISSEDLVEASSDNGAYVAVHAAAKRTAVKLSKTCNDLRLLSSGPRAGLNEINLPELQAGSSIMPAKVNPVMHRARLSAFGSRRGGARPTGSGVVASARVSGSAPCCGRTRGHRRSTISGLPVALRPDSVPSSLPSAGLGRFAAALRELASRQDVDETLQLAVDLATELVRGCELADVMFLRRGGVTTPVSSDALAREIDRIQQESNEGPCLSAARADQLVVSDELATDERWPTFGPRAVAEVGVHSALSFQLYLHRNGGDRYGALNLYSTSPSAFVEESIALGEVFAAQCATTLAAAIAREGAETALASRDLIGQAKGILMATEQLTAEEAFALLRRASQDLNVKLRDVADHVARVGALP
jgi:hypothetical protein